jgi:hypothetical protein
MSVYRAIDVANHHSDLSVASPVVDNELAASIRGNGRVEFCNKRWESEGEAASRSQVNAVRPKRFLAHNC